MVVDLRGRRVEDTIRLLSSEGNEVWDEGMRMNFVLDHGNVAM